MAGKSGGVEPTLKGKRKWGAALGVENQVAVYAAISLDLGGNVSVTDTPNPSLGEAHCALDVLTALREDEGHLQGVHGVIGAVQAIDRPYFGG